MLYLKALHIIFVVTWFAGLFYIVRLFIYHQEAEEKPQNEKDILQAQFLVMMRRLWFGITWPSAILTGLFGLSLIHYWWPISQEKWLIVKLIFVLGLYIYHFWCGKIFKDIKEKRCSWSSQKLRLWNEVATVFLIAIIFLVELKEIVSLAYGLFGLSVFSVILLGAIRYYRKVRESP